MRMASTQKRAMRNLRKPFSACLDGEIGAYFRIEYAEHEDLGIFEEWLKYISDASLLVLIEDLQYIILEDLDEEVENYLFDEIGVEFSPGGWETLAKRAIDLALATARERKTLVN